MTTDYDTPRVYDEPDPAAEYLTRLDTRRAAAAEATLAVDENSPPESGGVADLLGPGLLGDGALTVLAQQPDEFMCSRCFLVQHRTRRARVVKDQPICRDCA